MGKPRFWPLLTWPVANVPTEAIKHWSGPSLVCSLLSFHGKTSAKGQRRRTGALKPSATNWIQKCNKETDGNWQCRALNSDVNLRIGQRSLLRPHCRRISQQWCWRSAPVPWRQSVGCLQKTRQNTTKHDKWTMTTTSKNPCADCFDSRLLYLGHFATPVESLLLFDQNVTKSLQPVGSRA